MGQENTLKAIMENTLILISGLSDSDQDAVFTFSDIIRRYKIDCCRKLESIEINGDIGTKLG